MNTDHILTIEDMDRTVVLTDAEIILLRGLVGSYQHMMLLDLRKGALTETGIRDYRRSLAEAGELTLWAKYAVVHAARKPENLISGHWVEPQAKSEGAA